MDKDEKVNDGSKRAQDIFYGWVVLSVAFTTLVLGYTIRNTFSVFYPAIVEDFGWGRGNTAIMFSITIIVYGLVAPVAGAFVNRFNPRFVMSLGAAILGGGIALCGLANTQWHFYVLYGFVVATGLSLVGWTPFSAILSNWFVKKRGLIFGILSAGFGGSLVSAFVAQFLISTFGWRTAYVIMGCFALVIVIPLCGLLMYRSPSDKGLLPDGTPQIPPGLQDLREPSPCAVSSNEKWDSITWTLFRAMKTYQFWLLFLIAFFLIGLVETIGIAHQVYFYRDAGYAPMTAAAFYSVFGVTFVVGNLLSSFSDHFGRERVFMPSCLFAVGAVSLLFLIKDTSHPWMAFLVAIFLGLGLGIGVPVFFTTVGDLFQGSHLGSIMGTMILGFSLGGAISPWLAGFLHDKTESYFSTFLILLASLIISMVLMWLIAPRKIRPVQSKS